MSYYGVLYPSYWTGQTGRSLRKAGGKDALLLGAYLISNDHMNMIGLYRLPMPTVRTELGLTPAVTARALAAMQSEEFAFYDDVTAFVWVREMARFRLGIVGGSPLDRKDKKRIGAERLYESLAPNPFLGPFFDRYRQVLQLRHRREDSLRGGNDTPLHAPPQDVGLPSGSHAASKGLGSDFQGAPKSDQKQIRVQVQQKDKSSAADATPSALRVNGTPTGTPDENVGVITKIAHEVIELIGSDADDLPDTVKGLCAQRHIAYDSTAVRKAIDSARYQRSHRHDPQGSVA